MHYYKADFAYVPTASRTIDDVLSLKKLAQSMTKLVYDLSSANLDSHHISVDSTGIFSRVIASSGSKDIVAEKLRTLALQAGVRLLHLAAIDPTTFTVMVNRKSISVENLFVIRKGY